MPLSPCLIAVGSKYEKLKSKYVAVRSGCCVLLDLGYGIDDAWKDQRYRYVERQRLKDGEERLERQVENGLLHVRKRMVGWRGRGTVLMRSSPDSC
jgi:hypothetical protein